MTIDEIIEKNLNGINFIDFEAFFAKYSPELLQRTGVTSFFSLVLQAVKGEISLGFEDFVSIFFGSFGSAFRTFLPVFLLIAAICIITSIFSNVSTENTNVKQSTYFATLLAVATVLLLSFFSLYTLIKDTILAMKAFLELSFPVMLTTMAASGGVVSAKIFTPLALMLLTVLTNIIVVVVLPLFLFQSVFCVISNLNQNVKMSAVTETTGTAIKWILGLSFSIFMAFLIIKGISASIYDGVSLRAAKYTISNSVPIVGGYLKDGFDLVLASCALVKNAVGVGSLIIILLIAFSPMISLLCFYFLMKIMMVCIQPLCDDRIYGFFKDMNKNLLLLFTILAAATFLFFLSLMLFIMTGNAALG